VSLLGTRSLYLCTGDRPDLLEFVGRCIEGGVDVVQLREKELDAKAIIAKATELRRLCADRGVPFIVNDRPDIALAAGADGVHLGQDDTPVAVARSILGRGAIIGLSTHQRGEMDRALSVDADYLSAGPVVPTPTKPGRQGTGFDYVGYAMSVADRPVYVTGGATPETVGAMVEAGATRVVVVRYLTLSGDPKQAAMRLRGALDESLARHA